MILGKYRSFVVKKCEILLSEGAMSRSKARRSYCLSHFGRGLKVKSKSCCFALGGCGGIPPQRKLGVRSLTRRSTPISDYLPRRESGENVVCPLSNSK